jgi:PAS domain S-box-containing protein
MCQYDRVRFAPEVLLDVLRTHPVALIGSEVYDNFYFIPPSDLMSPHVRTLELGHWINNLADRRRNDEFLRESQRFLADIFASIQDGISILDRQFNIIHVNPTMERWYAHAMPIVGRKCYEAYHSRNAPCEVCPTRRALTAGEAAYEVVPKGGPGGEAVGWLDLYAFPLVSGARGSITGVIEYVRDITGRRRAEEDLRETNETLHALVQASPLAIVALDREGGVRMWNRAAEQTFGWTAEEVLGHPLPTLPDDKRQESRELREATLRGESVMGWETRRLRKDGSFIDVNLFAAPLHDTEGRIKGAMVLIADVTQRKRNEEERRRVEERIASAQKLESLGLLAGGIAHDFNNLLVGILGNADLALMEMSQDSRGRPLVSDIRKAALRASELTSEMLAYAGRARFNVGSVDLNALIRELAQLLHASVSKKAVLQFRLADPLPRIWADAVQIRQVVMNLIINASDALGEGEGVITIGTSACDLDGHFPLDECVIKDLAPGAYVGVEVSDTGCGMTDEVKNKMFDPFFTTKFAGRGLGLAAVLGIVRGHGGTIRVTSEPGRGSTFQVFLPCAPGGAESAEKPATATGFSHGTGTILVVDDEPFVRDVVRRSLEGNGFSVLTAEDGAEGVEILRRSGDRIRAVVLDMTMPRMNGEEAFREMRRLWPAMPILITSGYDEQEALDRFSRKDVTGFLQKPFQLQTLVEKVCRAIQG